MSRKKPKNPTSIRLSDDAGHMLDELEADMGLNRTQLMEFAIRELHRKRKPAKIPRESEESSGETA